MKGSHFSPEAHDYHKLPWTQRSPWSPLSSVIERFWTLPCAETIAGNDTFCEVLNSLAMSWP